MTTEPKKKRFWKIVITVLLVWLVLIPLVLVAVNAIVLRPRKRPLETRVPQLVGLDRKTAETKAREANVDMKVLLTRWDQPGPTGMILYQVPGVGESVEIGTVVGVTMSIEDPDAQFWKEKEEKVNSGSSDLQNVREHPNSPPRLVKCRHLHRQISIQLPNPGSRPTVGVAVWTHLPSKKPDLPPALDLPHSRQVPPTSEKT